MERSKIPYDFQVAIFYRDRWLCHYCRRPTVFAPAMKYLQRWVIENGTQVPFAYHHERWRRDTSPLLDDLGVVLDHHIAHSKRADNTSQNLVTACNKCNMHKSDRDFKEFSEKESFRYVKGRYGEPENWDGFVSVFLLLAERYSDELTPTERQWFKALRVFHASRALKKSSG